MPRDPLDVHFGQKLRQARLAAGKTQSTLAVAVGITFQQIQKYENASNRISFSRLVQIARVLHVEPEWFFEDLPGEDVQPPTAKEMAEANDRVRFARRFARLRHPTLQSIVLRLIDQLVAVEKSTMPPPKSLPSFHDVGSDRPPSHG